MLAHLPLYVEAQPRVLTNFQSLDPSFEDTSIDSRIHAFIDEFALNGYFFFFVFYYMWAWGRQLFKSNCC
jgi:hypothetical protein